MRELLVQRMPVRVQDGFIIAFEALAEHEDMRGHFIMTCGWSPSQFRAIRHQLWFTARVSAWKEGVELGCAYLGCCAYASPQDFIKDDYFNDLADEAISEAMLRDCQPAPVL